MGFWNKTKIFCLFLGDNINESSYYYCDLEKTKKTKNVRHMFPAYANSHSRAYTISRKSSLPKGKLNLFSGSPFANANRNKLVLGSLLWITLVGWRQRHVIKPNIFHFSQRIQPVQTNTHGSSRTGELALDVFFSSLSRKI